MHTFAIVNLAGALRPISLIRFFAISICVALYASDGLAMSGVSVHIIALVQLFRNQWFVLTWHEEVPEQSNWNCYDTVYDE